MTINTNIVKNIERVYREYFCLDDTCRVFIEEHTSRDDVEPGSVDILIVPTRDGEYTVYYSGSNGWTVLCIVEDGKAFYDERFVRKSNTDAIGNWMRDDLLYVLEQNNCIYVTDIDDVFEMMNGLAALRRFIEELGLYTSAEYKKAEYTCPCCGEDLRDQSYHCCDSRNFI